MVLRHGSFSSNCALQRRNPHEVTLYTPRIIIPNLHKARRTASGPAQPASPTQGRGEGTNGTSAMAKRKKKKKTMPQSRTTSGRGSIIPARPRAARCQLSGPGARHPVLRRDREGGRGRPSPAIARKVRRAVTNRFTSNYTTATLTPPVHVVMLLHYYDRGMRCAPGVEGGRAPGQQALSAI